MDYSPREYRGVMYTGIGEVNGYWPGDLIEQALGARMEPVISFFRLGTFGDKPTTWIHNDLAVAGATWAGILYLTDHPKDNRSGTAFWRHRTRGITKQASEVDFTEDEAIILNAEGQEERHWDMTGFVAMRKNRFIAYPATEFHSRYPLRAFGSNARDGRLIWVGFFKEGKSNAKKQAQTERGSP